MPRPAEGPRLGEHDIHFGESWTGDAIPWCVAEGEGDLLGPRTDLMLISIVGAVASDGSVFTYDNVTVTVSR